MTIDFTIDGVPVGKGRPRFSRQGSFVHTYTPEKTANYEQFVRLSYRKATSKSFTADENIKMTVLACFAIPKNVSRPKRMQMIIGSIRPRIKPDLDNIIKAICDALNGLAYPDDK